MDNLHAVEDREVADEIPAGDRKAARYMYYGGFLFLPWLWLVNWIQYRGAAKRDDAPEDFRRRMYLVRFCLFIHLSLSPLRVCVYRCQSDPFAFLPVVVIVCVV